AKNERVPMSIRIRGELFNKLSRAAELNDRPLGNECELRLERSFDRTVLPEQHREIMLLLGSAYLYGGPNQVVRTMYALGDVSPEEREVVRYGMLRTAEQLNPNRKFVFPGDEP